MGCCTHADCLPSVSTLSCAHDVMTRFFQHAGTSKVCSDFNEQCEDANMFWPAIAAVLSVVLTVRAEE